MTNESIGEEHARFAAVLARLATDLTRCPGCGSVLVTATNRGTCWKTSVDTTQPGYLYLADTWGYCYTLSRHIKHSEGAIWLRHHPTTMGVRGP